MRKYHSFYFKAEEEEKKINFLFIYYPKLACNDGYYGVDTVSLFQPTDASVSGDSGGIDYHSGETIDKFIDETNDKIL